jgi:bifunctional oligoribonuclease and PAP phosphatase NrnA
LGKNVICVNEDGAVKRLQCIPGVSEVVKQFPDGIKLLIACDCGDRRRIGDELSRFLGRFETIINIDHHATNDYFGAFNYVDATASSTSEIILRLLENLTVSLTPEIATALFYGISGDTGSFRYSSTTADCFEAARKLVIAGAKPADVNAGLYSQVSLSAMKLHAEAIAQLVLLADGKIAEALITDEMVQRHGAEPEDGEDLKHITQTIAGVEVAIVIREFKDLWRVSLRSKDPNRDVAKVAEDFGGGGHKAAAAFRWRGTLDALRAKVRPKLIALVS